MAISGTTPEPPAISSIGPPVVRVPDEVPADRAAQLDPVAEHHDVVHEGRDLAVGQPLDGQLHLARRGSDRDAIE